MKLENLGGSVWANYTELSAEEKAALTPLLQGGKAVLKPQNPFPGERQRIALKQDALVEDAIAKNVIRLLYKRERGKVDKAVIESLIKEFEKGKNFKLHYQQRKAVVGAVNSNLFILTGGPGTGKTTVLNCISYVLRKLEGCSIVYVAPTGKAAKRITESTGEEATTVQRKFCMHEGDMRASELMEDVVIIDETSMLDMYVMGSIVQAFPSGKRLILVGDTNQLVSVGKGAVLRDLIDSEIVPYVGLTFTFRQAEGSTLLQNIKNVEKGRNVLVEGNDFKPVCISDNATDEEIRSIVLSIWQKEVGLWGQDNVTVLLPYRKKGICSNDLNNRMQAVSNPGDGCTFKGEDGNITFKVGDKVMQLKNRKDISLANGEIGIVTKADAKGIAVSYIDVGTVFYSYKELWQLSLAYAMTVHKSQGSEWESVVVVCLNSHKAMHDRSLIFTGFSRGKKKVTFVYQKKAFERSMVNQSIKRRKTGLVERIGEVLMEHRIKYAI